MLQKYIKFSVFLLLLAACKEENINFSDTPSLELVKTPEQYKLNGADSLVRITLKYTDGDGDIGLEPQDTAAPFNWGSKFFYNLFIRVYSVENGVASPILIPLTTDTVHYNDRITNLTPTGKRKSIFGEIVINLKAEPYPGVQPDSMFYTFQIADRSLKLSNIIQTPTMRFEF